MIEQPLRPHALAIALFVHPIAHNIAAPPEHEDIKPALGTQLDEHKEKGVAVYLYELNKDAGLSDDEQN